MASDSGTMMGELELERGRRVRLFRLVSLITLGGAAGVLLFFVVMAFVAPSPSFNVIIPVILVYFLGSLLSTWMGQHGNLEVAIPVYVVSTLIGMLTALYFFNGVTGPFAVALVILPVTTGLLAGRRAAFLTAGGIALAYVTMALLEGLGVLEPPGVSGSVLFLIYVGMSVLTVSIAAVVSGLTFEVTERTLALLGRQGARLAQISRQAEEAARLEREAREREERAARQLRRTIYEYTHFLEQVSAGDYTARLALEEGEGVSSEADELRLLGVRLNQTVDALVTALDELQQIQRRYVREAWEAFIRTGAAHRGFCLQGDELTADETAWLAPMAEAAQERRVVVSGQELAIPLVLRGEVIGTLGLRREDGGEWNEDELALAAAIGDQLTQTIESLRLLDETQRRAAREESSRQVIARIRETLDVEEVLRAAVREIRHTMGIPEVTVRLTSQSGE